MKVSLNLVKRFTDISVDTSELVNLIGTKLGAIDEVIDLGKAYEGAVMVKVVECVKHPEADKLSKCRIDDGGVMKDAPRDSQGLIEVICGAPNVRADMMAVWLNPGSVVPSTYGSSQPMKIDSKELRGVVSHGMLASGKELGINDDHSGILEVDKPASVGQKFSELYELDDIIIDIENKMLTHRPDCFGQLGIVREIAGIIGIPFKSPNWYLDQGATKVDEIENSLIRVENQIPDLVPEFLVQVINNVQVKPSDIQTQSYLSRLGIRPINNIVDQTNLYMMITAQPLHAYDLDKLKTVDGSSKPSFVIRKPNPNEELELLNGKTIKLNSESMIIATKSKAIGIGGVMGGITTEVDNNTKNIVLECATFNMYSIRKSAMEYGLFSEAVTRFNKGQSSLQNIHILPEVVRSITKVSGGQADSSIVRGASENHELSKVGVSVDAINNLLGIDLDSSKISEILTNVEIGVTGDQSELNITPPFWRTDITISEDVIEEVGRLYGYDKLILKLPTRSCKPAEKNKMMEFKLRVGQILTAAGGNETITYSFVHKKLIDASSQDYKLAYSLSNAVSPDNQYYRLSLTPSLLEKVHPNIKNGFDNFVLFELSKVVQNNLLDDTESNLPKESNRLAVVLANDTKLSRKNTPYYNARTYLDYLMNQLSVNYTLKEMGSDGLDQLSKPYEMVRSAQIIASDQVIGVIGEPTSKLKAELKLPANTSMFELYLDQLLKCSGTKDYMRLSHYPKIEQDICFRVPANTRYLDLFKAVCDEVSKFSDQDYFNLKPIDIFQQDDNSPKQVTFRLSINSYQKTLTSKDIEPLISSLNDIAKTSFSGEII